MTVYVLGAGASCCTDAYGKDGHAGDLEMDQRPPLMGHFFRLVVDGGLHKRFPGNQVNVILEPLGISIEGLGKGCPAGVNLETVVSLIELAKRLLREWPHGEDASAEPSQALRKMCEAMKSEPIFGDDPTGTVRQVAESAVQRAMGRSSKQERKDRSAMAGRAYAEAGWAMQGLLGWIEHFYAPTEPYVYHQLSACSNYTSFFRRLRADDTVITLNYDFLLDRVLEEMGNLGFGAGEALPTVFEVCGGKGGYLKLHGSVLWWVEYTEQEMKQRYLVSDPLGTVRSHGFTDRLPQVKVQEPWVPSRNCEMLIVPPVVAKTFRPEIEKLWGRAEDALSRAQEVYVIGYSFPCTDRHVKEMTRSRRGGYDGTPVRIVTKQKRRKERKRLVRRVKDGFPCAEVEIESNDGFDQWVKG